MGGFLFLVLVGVWLGDFLLVGVWHGVCVGILIGVRGGVGSSLSWWGFELGLYWYHSGGPGWGLCWSGSGGQGPGHSSHGASSIVFCWWFSCRCVPF